MRGYKAGHMVLVSLSLFSPLGQKTGHGNTSSRDNCILPDYSLFPGGGSTAVGTRKYQRLPSDSVGATGRTT